ncbi:hypothetical protein LF1_48740 [Rubripirellula obstinata]|uniref:Uncharacterized protein n=1 Tax=Rubripirellula obstinata TaxID=406547 RepID=A0A5B1CRP4_9BACT|nr:hypothetical protein [Rubripirellula obstinata]KAA1262310.1 hypothetical protein LF1_48740 [Rubripirellula obstinata]
MKQSPQVGDLPLPSSADVSHRIYRNAEENRVLRSLHRLLLKLERSRCQPNAIHKDGEASNDE